MSKQKEKREEQLLKVFEFIERFNQREGRSPSFEEIGIATYMSRSNVARYIDMLEGRGSIRRLPGVPRSISVVKRP